MFQYTYKYSNLEEDRTQIVMSMMIGMMLIDLTPAPSEPVIRADSPREREQEGLVMMFGFIKMVVTGTLQIMLASSYIER